jgi:N-acetylglucosaminyldiphosphoundecaprenol N-acetyl-beta-D-mannosaminyltransferase
MKNNIIVFHGIKFFNESFSKIFFRLNKGKSGYLIAPAASSLSKIFDSKTHHEALVRSKIAILDSGLFCILLFIFKGFKLKKFSGYLFFIKFINQKFIHNKKILTIDPNIHESKKNRFFLLSKNIKYLESYVAPIYNKNQVNIRDKKLIKLINKFRPRYILTNIGGEVQEKLALYICDNIRFKVIVICTGAAIGFCTGAQAPVNHFIDKYYLGWLLRVIYNPNIFFFRVLKSIKIIKLFF